ncbi:MAG: dihydrodipicolinate synthase family protein [Planctomycetaceae bacterium]
MATEKKLSGVVPIIPTPFREDESIDFDALASSIEFAAKCGLSACCLPAFGSEFYKMLESERKQVIETAIKAANGNIAVVAQSNHPSAKNAAALAQMHTDMGADLISFAMPRQFALTQPDQLDYAKQICRATTLPVLIQDFNPGGPTVGGDFARQLADECPNFRYLKLEEPLMSVKVESIRQATGDRIGVLEGWGGMYLLDLIPSGICGLMPVLGYADVLQKVWTLGKAGDFENAMNLFQYVLPQTVFALQNMELLHTLEKKLLASRGIIPESSTFVRKPTWTPDAHTLEHGLKVNEWSLRAVKILTELR